MSSPGSADGELRSAQAQGQGQGQVLLGSARGALRSEEALGPVYRLSDPTLSELPLDKLLDTLLDRVRAILAVDTVAILLLDRDRRELVARAAKGLEEEVEQGVRIPVGGGFAGRIAALRRPIFIADVDHADVLNPILREQGVHSLLGVPLVDTGQLIGVLHVGSMMPRAFTDDDAALLQLAAARAAPAISRGWMLDALEHEHHLTQVLQRSLLPAQLPATPEVHFAARYHAARDEVGGDWYDVVDLERGRFGVVIGDVAGHGVRAAAVMGQLRAAVRTLALEGHPPDTVLERVAAVLRSAAPQRMATAAFLLYDATSGEMTWAGAGHPPPVLVGPDGVPALLDRQATPPLGVTPFPRYEADRVRVPDGGTLLLYTDGVVERRGEPLRAGLERLVGIAAGEPSPDALCDRVVEGLLADPGAADDDAALLALHSVRSARRLSVQYPADPTVLGGLRFTLRRWLERQGADEEVAGAVIMAVGEACANAIEHAYSPSPAAFSLTAERDGDDVVISVHDTGRWRAPRGVNRGRGIGLMEAFMDRVDIVPGDTGTSVRLRRALAPR